MAVRWGFLFCLRPILRFLHAVDRLYPEKKQCRLNVTVHLIEIAQRVGYVLGRKSEQKLFTNYSPNVFLGHTSGAYRWSLLMDKHAPCLEFALVVTISVYFSTSIVSNICWRRRVRGCRRTVRQFPIVFGLILASLANCLRVLLEPGKYLDRETVMIRLQKGNIAHTWRGLAMKAVLGSAIPTGRVHLLTKSF